MAHRTHLSRAGSSRALQMVMIASLLALVALLLLLASGCATPAASTTPTASTTPVAATTIPSISTTSHTQAQPDPEPTLEERILAGMTLRQKAAQVMLVSFDGIHLDSELTQYLHQGPPGGVLLLARNVETAPQVAALVTAIQEQARMTTAGGLGLLVAVDQEGGGVARIQDGVPAVPSARRLGDESNPQDAAQMARETAAGLLALGVNMNLAPVGDVVSDPNSFLFSRSFSDDAGRVAAFVTAVVDAYQEMGMAAAVKHFPGHGSARGDTHTEQAVSEAARDEFETIHLVPFRAAIAAGVRGVMMSHLTAAVYDPERPASLSPYIIEDLLRGRLGFQGLVIADDLAMAAAGGDTPAVQALAAGCDLLILTTTYPEQQEAQEAIIQAVEAGGLSEDRLDSAVLRILQLKHELGLLKTPGPTEAVSP